MPLYEFVCLKCNKDYEELANFDDSGKYPKIKCPFCDSKKKVKKMSLSGFTFSNPVGTDKWSNSHDYRFKHNIPKVKQERGMAEAVSKFGSDPYKSNNNDLKLGEGIHDAQTRSGLT